MNATEQVNKIFTNLLPGYLGIKILTAVPDEVTGSLTVEEHHCTGGGIMHGGAIMTLADTLGAVGAFLNVPHNYRTTTVESKTNFLRPAKVGERVTGRCRLLNKGRTLILLQTEVSDSKGKLMAVVSQSQMVLPGSI